MMHASQPGLEKQMNFQKWDQYGDMLVGVFHRITLFAIGAATVTAGLRNSVEAAANRVIFFFIR